MTSRKRDPNVVPLNGNYVKYQREKIRKQNKQIMILYLIILLLLAIMVYGSYQISQAADTAKEIREELELTNYTLETVIDQRNNAIIELENLKENYDQKLIDAVRDLTGNIVDKTIAVVYLEATNQGEIGMQLVADTIFNRANYEYGFGDSVSEVLRYPKQFNVLTKLNTITSRTKQSKEYLLAQQIVYDKIIDGKTYSAEVLYFMNPSISNRGSADWMRTKDHVITYKDHVFYQ